MRGSVVKRGSKFSIVYYIGKDTAGKWIQKWESGFSTRREAERILRERIDELEKSFSRSLDRSPLSSYLNYWIENYCERKLARNTLNGYRVNIEKHIIPYIGNVPMYKLAPEHIEKLYSQLRQNQLSETSIRYVHNVLNSALNYAVRRRTIPYNILKYVDPPKKDMFHSDVLNVDDTAVLIGACRDTELFIPIMLAVTMGLRRGEVLGLCWDDIDLDNCILTVNRTATYYKNSELYLSAPKTNSSNRSLVIPSFLHDVLKEISHVPVNDDLNPNHLVCCRASGLPLSAGVLQKQFKKVLSDNNLPNIRFHDLRHTYATLLLRKQVPAKIVSSMMGHSNIGITLDTYSHVLTEMQDPAITAIETLFCKT